MSIEIDSQKSAEIPIVESTEAVEIAVGDKRGHRARQYLAVGLAGIALSGGFVGWSKYQAHAAESCEQTFDLPLNGSSEPVLKSPDGVRFKLRVGQMVDSRAVELGFLVYGRHENPSMFDMFGGTVETASVLPTEVGPGPEATFTVDNRTKLLVDVTVERVKTRCVPTETAAGVTQSLG